MIHNPFYWWCDTCNDNVDTFEFSGVGVYCQMCANKVRKPDNRPDPKIIPEDTSEDYEELPVDDIVIDQDEDT